MRTLTTAWLLVLLLAPTALVAPAGAQDSEAPIEQAIQAVDSIDTAPRSGPEQPHPEAEEAIGKLRSPFCPGLMLEVCPSPYAAELRDSLQSLARLGVESDTLVEWVIANYGEEWRALPKREGAGILAWVLPPAALVLGLIGLLFAFQRIRKNRTDAPDEAPVRSLSDEERDRLRSALKELDEEEEALL